MGADGKKSLLEKFYLCFCFSIQTMSTIGYGTPLAPRSLYVQGISAIEAFVSVMLTACITGATFAKMSRPTKITRQIIFSEVAVINQASISYKGGVDKLDWGSYEFGSEPVLTLRIANTRKSQLCDTQCRLLLLRRETEDGRPCPSKTYDQNQHCVERLHELEFELTCQLGRVRSINYSLPYLALPWTIRHTINEKSPLYGINPNQWLNPENEFELIVVLDGVDESVSMNIQARWSYLPSEIIWGARFVEIVKRDHENSYFEIDYSKFSKIEMLDSPLKYNFGARNTK